MFFVLTIIAALWLIAVGALLFSLQAFSVHSKTTPKSVANGAIYMGVLALSIVVNVAVIFPALLLLQPSQLLRVLRAERHALTPRQRFRGTRHSFTERTSLD